jgi:hypothetical protein
MWKSLNPNEPVEKPRGRLGRCMGTDDDEERRVKGDQATPLPDQLPRLKHRSVGRVADLAEEYVLANVRLRV